MSELEDLKNELNQTKLLLQQEQGKNKALHLNNLEITRQAKLATEQAQALANETSSALVEGAEQMKLYLAVSQGVWSLGQMGRAYMARKIAAGRVCYREAQAAILMQQAIDAHKQGNTQALTAAFEKMSQIVKTVKEDGEANRLAAVEASQAYGLKIFTQWWETAVSENNEAYPEAK